MTVLNGKSLGWILGSVALLGIVAAVLIGQNMSMGGAERSASVSPEAIMVEPQVSTNPVDAGVVPEPQNLSGSVQRPNGNQSVSGQNNVPASIEITPVEDTNPVKTQHQFTVTVKQANGAPATGAEVQFILNRFSGSETGDGGTVYSVGDIVDIGGVGKQKVDNTFGIVATDSDGQATLTITATREGETDVTAYAPAIADADAHKVFAVKRWVDIDVDCPPAQPPANQAGSPHEMTVVVYRSTDGKTFEGDPVTPLAGQTVHWEISDVGPEGSFSATATRYSTTVVTDDQGRATATLHQVSPVVGSNTIQVSVVDESDRPMFSCEVIKEWVAQALSVSKTGPQRIGLLNEGTYTITVTNTGNSTATDATLTDILPAGLQYVSSNPPASQSGDTLSWSLGNIAAGDSTNVTVALQGVVVGTHTNTATAESGRYAGTDSWTTEVFAGDLSVAKTGPSEVALGDVFTYTVTVTNNGDGGLSDVTLTERLPAAFSFVGGSPAATDEAGPSWDLGDMPQGDSRVIQVEVKADQIGSHTNAVDVASTDGPTANATFTTNVVSPSVTVTKTVTPEEILVGESAVFTIVVSNDGDGAASNVDVLDALPVGLTQTSGALLSDVIHTIPSIAPGATQTFTIGVRADVAGTHRNTVTVSTGDESNSDEAILVVLQPMVSIEKTGRGALYTGQVATYTLTASNPGAAALTGVVISDTFPGELSYVSSTGNGTEANGVVTWPAVDLAVGESHSVTVTFRGDTAGSVTNTASVRADQDTSDEDSLGITVIPAAGADIDIVDNPDPAIVGETITFTVTVDNQGSTAPMTNVQVTVTLAEQFDIEDAGDGAISGNAVDFYLASLGAGQQHTFVITAEATAAGAAETTAQLTYDEFGGANSKTQGTTIIEP